MSIASLSHLKSAAADGRDLEEFAERLGVIISRLSRYLRHEARQEGISSVDMQLLARIRRNPRIGISELAQLEGISRPSMSLHIKRLVDLHWVARQPVDQEGDQRRVQLRLTEEGLGMLEIIRQRHRSWISSRLNALPQKDVALLVAAENALLNLLEHESLRDLGVKGVSAPLELIDEVQNMETGL